MTLKTEQIDWMREIANKLPVMQAAADLQNSKDLLLAEAFKELDGKVAEIKVGEDFAMEMRSTGLGGFLRRAFKAAPKTSKAISGNGDPDSEFDTGHDLADSAGLTPAQATALTKAHGIIIKQVDGLRSEIDPATKKRLFTDVEISREIFEPLMRRKIIPENAVSNRYSDVSRTFDAAAEQYNVRLAAYTESVSSYDGVAAKLGLSSELIKGAGTAANSIMSMLTAVVPGMKDFPITEATDVCTAITTALSAPLDITATVLKDKGLNPGSVEKIAKTVAGAATGWVTAAFDIKFDGGTDQDAINKQVGKAINAGLTIGLSGVTFAAKLVEGGDKAKEAFDELGSMVEQCLVCAGSASAYRDNVKDDLALAATGRHVKAAMLGSKELVVLASAALSDDPIGTATAALQNLVKAAVADGAGTYFEARKLELKAALDEEQAEQDGEDPEKADEHAAEAQDEQNFRVNLEYPERAERIKSGLEALEPEALDVTAMLKLAQTRTTEQLEALFEEDEQLKANKAAQKLMLAVAEKRDAELEAAGAKMEDDIAKDDEVFRSLLAGSESGDAEADVESIEILILQIKKDQMVTKIAEAVVKGGAAVIAAFLPPASIAVDAIQLLISMRKAAAHLQAWIEWDENVTDAKSAMSVQVSAMANRANISRGQAARKSVEALEAAVKIVGDSFATVGGPFAAAGIAVSKGVSAVSTVKDLALKVYDEVQLKREWAKYKKALAHPDDRKAIRAAIRGNATLAKYVIAYGARIAGDPVAKNALKKCGLSDKVLQSPKSNEQLVVSYLETLYADDPVVLERLDEAPDWHPGPIELKAVSIAAFSHAGQKKAKPPLAAPIDKALITSVLEMEQARDALDRARADWEAAAAANPHDDDEEEAALEEFVGCLNRYAQGTHTVVGRLIQWRPVTAGGDAHKEGGAYGASLGRFARALQKKADQEASLYEDGPA